ncbi:MAG: hypothetical protein JJT89_09205, partial [Nitriliruptoraceae bacterium]|nr:hypothetical protein [Nitriliruptoraceae bacterium]
MNRRVVPLSGATLDTLPADCRRCRYWELGIAPGASARHPVDAAARRDGAQHDAAADKRAWIEDRLASGGVPGWTVQAEGETVAYALAGPAAWFHHPPDRPGTGQVPRPAPPPATTQFATQHLAPPP